MERSSASRSTFRRFTAAAVVVVLCLAAVSTLIRPDEERAPVVIDHSRADPGAAPFSNDAATNLRADLDSAMSDQEISNRSVSAVDAVSPAVVVVYRLAEDGTSIAIGSGIAIDEDGYILASLDTTGSDGEVAITWPDGVSDSARIVRIDELYRVVLLKSTQPARVVAQLAGYSSRSGDRVLAIGSPLDDFASTVTSGVVGAVGVAMPATASRPAIPDLIQHDAATNPGNEGGPIVDLNGLVVGINIGSVVQQGNEITQGWSFAVPVDVLGPLLATER